MHVDGRIIIVGGFTLILWLINAVGQHFVSWEPRVKVSRPIAVFAGSSSHYIVWRGFAIQVGLVFNFLLYTFLTLTCGSSSLGITGFLSMLIMLLVLLFDPHEQIKR